MERQYGEVHLNYGEEQQVQALMNAGVSKKEAVEKVIYAKRQMLDIQKQRADNGDELAKKLVHQIEIELGVRPE